jgi:hypothetical protein
MRAPCCDERDNIMTHGPESTDLEQQRMSLDKDLSDSLNTSSADQTNSQEDTYSFSRYVSRHSSRSSSFNESSAEIILGLFREENRIKAGFGHEYTDEEDHAVREMLILTKAQKPDSWVSRRLAMVELWNDSDDDGGTVHPSIQRVFLDD